MNKTPEGIFAEYEKGQEYNRSIDLYETVARNEDFFIGNQWRGVKAPDLEQPVLNFLHRVTTYLISMIVSDDVAVSFTPFQNDEATKRAVKILAAAVERVMERTKAKAKNRDMLRNSVVDGDGCFYLYFNHELETGQLARGDLELELVDNTKILFGNPYQTEVQNQPYLLLVKRDLLEQVREEAKKNGVRGWDAIQADDGDSREESKDQGRLVTVVMKLWKEEGRVKFIKTTRTAVIKEETELHYTLYPIAVMPWEKVKNSYHGQSALTAQIPNQIFVNKMWAMAMEQQKLLAFPKVIYDNTRIKAWDNRVGQAIGVSGNPNEAIASGYKAPDMSGQVFQIVDSTINYTKDFMGASDAALGNVKPDNTSAIIAVQKASAAPLELQRMAFYQFVEDYVRIMLDIMHADYGERLCSYQDEQGQTRQELFDFSGFNRNAMELNIDVGSAAYFSELTQMMTNDNLFTKGIITDAITYLEGIPDQYIRNKNQIIEKLRAQQPLPMQGAEQAMTSAPMQGALPAEWGPEQGVTDM